MRVAAVLAAFFLAEVKVSAENIDYFNIGRTYYHGQSVTLSAYNEDVTTTTQDILIYVVIRDSYGFWIATLTVNFTSDNSAFDPVFSDSGENDDSDGNFGCDKSGPSGSVSYGSVDRGVTITYTPPDGVSFWTMEVTAYMDLNGGSGSAQITAW